MAGTSFAAYELHGRRYVPRSPTTGVLYGVVRTHLADFLAAVEARTDGLPPLGAEEDGPEPRRPRRISPPPRQLEGDASRQHR